MLRRFLRMKITNNFKNKKFFVTKFVILRLAYRNLSIGFYNNQTIQ